MILCIAGSRSITRVLTVREAVAEAMEEFGIGLADITQVVSGLAKGPDLIGKRLAEKHGIPVQKFPADWDNLDVPGAVIRRRRDNTLYNVLAGYHRNEQMAQYLHQYAGRAVLIHDGKSTGTMHMLRMCETYDVPYFLKTLS